MFIIIIYCSFIIYSISCVCIYSFRIASNPSIINRCSFQQVAKYRTASAPLIRLFSASGPSNNIDLFSKQQTDTASSGSTAESVNAAATSRQDEKQRKMMDEAVKLRRQAAELEVCDLDYVI